MNSSYFDSVQQSNESANDMNSTAIASHTLNSQLEHFQLELSPHQPNCPAAAKEKMYAASNKYTLKHRQQEYTASIVGKTNDLFLTRGNGTAVGIGLGNFNGKIKMNPTNSACHLTTSLEQANAKNQSTEFSLKRNLINTCKTSSFSSTMFLINSEKGERREKCDPYEANLKSDQYEPLTNEGRDSILDNMRDENYNKLNHLNALDQFSRRPESDYLINLINNQLDAPNSQGEEQNRAKKEINEKFEGNKSDENNAKLNSVTLIIDEVDYDELRGRIKSDRVWKVPSVCKSWNVKVLIECQPASGPTALRSDKMIVFEELNRINRQLINSLGRGGIQSSNRLLSSFAAMEALYKR